ncbi:DUF1697 domain-containing protein [Lysinibacillus sp. OL1_EC]|uniref:DUF1697 domain-containing protein n=1 Tax=unclassified Lysinibacillus TaxID=2636778 RepID=UPI001040CF87|nr:MULTISPECIES: DUF1697 domain-containing protein [unclassified Lysinibacillus]MCM0622952.1 DUF1697 domain-containing protein [Lysinibacillus sp. OL1_EC]MCS5499644.1 DUF1697 domain-containing protein [Lysinibacillus sp. A4]TBV90118.1 DUF1697 domain-containing protein [Lysinibacillus sp. OL1]UKJ47256.1 DUF1697 domain-containing protein [Lysinibacillus sp. ACHW1.5]
MTKYVALLRGINVGGHNKLKMAELRDALQPLGLQNIRTYIQSGNILFESSESEELLQQQIQETIQTTFTITSTVIIRTAEEFCSIVNNCPFSDQDLADARAVATGESLHVALLPTVPTEENGAKLLQYASEKERCMIKGRDVYLLFYDSIRNAKLSQQLHKLEVPATVRNWKTMMKLATMIGE